MTSELVRCLAVHLVAILAAAQAVEPSDFEGLNSRDMGNFTLYPGDRQSLTLHGKENYHFLVDMTSSWSSYSSFVFQIHSQKYNITVQNGTDCTSVECWTTGQHVGMVQLWTSLSSVFDFYVTVESPCNVTVFAAVVGIPNGDPIPGGCSMTSYIDIDAQLQSHFTSYTTTVEFQDANQGFYPPDDPPVCDAGKTASVTKVEYRLYHQCLGARDFDEGDLFDAVEDMMTPHLIEHHELLYISLDYNTKKRVIFDSIRGQGVVYNVIALDKDSNAMSAYIPMATYACNITSTGENGCHPILSTLSIVGALIVGVIGLFLCYFAHRFFHVETFVFSFLIFLFVWYLALEAGFPDWSDDTKIGLSIGLAIVMATLLFTLWFFTGWYYIFVMFFGAIMGFLIIATLFYTPLGTLSPLLMVDYVYILIHVCGMVVIMIPLVAFPRALNIFSSSFVGGYAVIYCVGMLTYSSVVKVVLKVVKNVTIPRFLSTHIDCPFELTDIALLCAWFVLVVTGVVIQAITSAIHQRSYERRERQLDSRLRHSYRRYVPFPKSPYKQIKEFLEKRKERRTREYVSEDQRPLLSPTNSLNRGSQYY